MAPPAPDAPRSAPVATGARAGGSPCRRSPAPEADPSSSWPPFWPYAAGLALCAGVIATSCLTPAQWAGGDGQAIEAGVSVACDAATWIPVPIIAGLVATACRGAEADVTAAVSKAAAELAQADAGAPAPADARRLLPLYATRHGRRVRVGMASACLCASAQRHLDAMEDGGAPLADAGATQTGAPDLHSTSASGNGLHDAGADASAPVDGGKDGGA